MAIDQSTVTVPGRTRFDAWQVILAGIEHGLQDDWAG